MAEMSKIEEVARAIHAKHRKPDNNKHWFHEDPAKCELSRQLARAAIKAMPAPTPRMLAAGWAELTKAKKIAGIARLGAGPGLSDGYRAMVSAALSEEVAG